MVSSNKHQSQYGRQQQQQALWRINQEHKRLNRHIIDGEKLHDSQAGIMGGVKRGVT